MAAAAHEPPVDARDRPVSEAARRREEGVLDRAFVAALRAQASAPDRAPLWPLTYDI